MTRPLGLGLLFAALLLSLACGGKKKEAAPAEAAKAAPEGGGTATGRPALGKPPEPYTGPRQPRVVRKLAAISVDEVGPLLAAPADAREIRPIAKARVGERVEAAWCFDAGDMASIGAAVAKHYTAAGWGEMAVKPNPSVPDRVTISAAKAPFALFGSLQKGRWAECDGDKGQIFLQLGAHHVEAVEPAAAPAPVGAGGATGLRAPGAPVPLAPRQPQ